MQPRAGNRAILRRGANTVPGAAGRVLAAIGLVLALVLVLASCTRRASWHEQLTVHFSTPDGPVSVSRVLDVDFTEGRELGPIKSPDEIHLIGEALVAPLGDTQLFIPLDHISGVRVWYARSQLKLAEGTRAADDLPGTVAQRAPLELLRNLWPVMVTFTDPADPASLALVDPDALDATFGPGYAIERLTIQTTSDPVTHGRVVAALPWIHDPIARIGGDQRREYGDPLNGLFARHFVRN